MTRKDDGRVSTVGCICICVKCEDRGLHATDECHIEDERLVRLHPYQVGGRESGAKGEFGQTWTKSAVNPAAHTEVSLLDEARERIRELDAEVQHWKDVTFASDNRIIALKAEDIRIRAIADDEIRVTTDRAEKAEAARDAVLILLDNSKAHVQELEERIEALHAEANAREISISNLKARVVRFEECDDERKATVKECERLRTRVKELEDVIRSALGEIGDFPPRPEGGPPYWWRAWLREKARLSTMDRKRFCACDQECGCCEEE